jgi:hypothetical protein
MAKEARDGVAVARSNVAAKVASERIVEKE